ncbi:MAG: hypothetical protein N4A61_00065 [Pelagimonas sp.]|jgi:hypothetical protein|nr:hypothetical protein [Pelagimonas sp.]
MEPINLRIVSDSGVEATISSDGRHVGNDDCYATVSVKGVVKQRRVYGIDPLQSFVLGLQLIEDLTSDKRIGDENQDHSAPGSPWRIEVIED